MRELQEDDYRTWAEQATRDASASVQGVGGDGQRQMGGIPKRTRRVGIDLRPQNTVPLIVTLKGRIRRYFVPD